MRYGGRGGYYQRRLVARVQERVQGADAFLYGINVGDQTLERQGLGLREAVNAFRAVHPRAQTLVEATRFLGPGRDNQGRPVQVLHEG